MVKKIISGGQTGADRAALDVAIELGILHGVPNPDLDEDSPAAVIIDALWKRPRETHALRVIK
ncbi:MAG: putative molybdenum carrier protein [Pseudomonadota bacterium]